MFLLTLSLASALLCAPSPAQTQDALDAAFFDYAHDRVPEAMGGLADHIRFEAARLAELAPEAPEAQALADELEIALIAFDRMGQDLRNEAVRLSLLEGVTIDPAHGSLYARLAWLEDAELDRLHPMLDWQFAGPFDNERGRGMVRATPAEKDPRAASYTGKVREVVWRELPAVPPRAGLILFGDLIEPSEQACVLARTYVYSEEARDVHWMLGGSEELRVWFQGQAVFQAIGEHAFGFDAYAVAVTLEAGWNEFVVKVGSHEQAPMLQARLVDAATGAPLALHWQAAPPADVTDEAGKPRFPLELEDPGRRLKDSSQVTRLGAARRYEAAESAEAAFRLALVEVEAQAVPRSDRAGAQRARQALDAEPDHLRYRILAIQTERELGASAIEEDVNPYLQLIEEGLRLHGEVPWLLRQRAAFSARLQRSAQMALPWMQRAQQVAPESFFVRRDLSQLLGALDLDDRAESMQRAIGQDPAMRVWAGRSPELAYLLPAGQADWKAWTEAGRSAGSTLAIQAWHEQKRLIAGVESAEAWLTEYEELRARTPWSVGLRLRFARSLFAAGHLEEALALTVESQALSPDRADAASLAARLQWALGDRDAAVAQLERAVELHFGDEAERRLLETWRTDKTEDFHEVYREPLADILQRRSGDEPLGEGAGGWEVLLQRTVTRVQPDGTSQAYHREVFRVLTESGAQSLDRRGFRSDPRTEEVRVLQAGVQRPDGTFLDAETGRSNRRGTAVVDFPPLAIGDVIDVEWRHDVVRTGVFGNYFGALEALVSNERLYLRESEFVLLAPESFPLYLHERNYEGDPERRELEGDLVEYRWHVEHVAPARQEGWMPPTLERAPQVHASSFASWQDFGRWWWSLIEEEMKPSPAIIEKVQALTADCETPAEKLRAIYNFVVTDIRYNAWEFGVHGYEPYSAAVIFSRGFGDCKDKAILMRVMLDQVGIEAWPVLIRSEDRRFEEDLSLPLVEHFNHCIAYIPEQEGLDEMFLDGTARMHPLETLPSSDAGAKVIVVKADGVEEHRIRFPEASDNFVRENIRIDMRPEEGPEVTLTRSSFGRYDVQDRYQTAGSEEQRMEWAERFLSGRFGALVGDPKVTWSDPEDLNQTVETTLQVQVESVSRPTEKGLELPTTFQPMDLLTGIASEPQRSTDLLLDVPTSRETVIDYVFGEGAQPVDLPAPVRVETPEGAYVRTIEATGDGVRVTERFELRTHRIAAEAYGAFRELCREVDRAQGQSIEVEVKQ